MGFTYWFSESIFKSWSGMWPQCAELGGGEAWVLHFVLPLVSRDHWSFGHKTCSGRMHFLWSQCAGPREGKGRSCGLECPWHCACTFTYITGFGASQPPEVHVDTSFLQMKSPRLRKVKWLVLLSTFCSTWDSYPWSACCLSENFKKGKYLFSRF